mmetsp:Transcript_69347/g.166247  ORF Transcript_69347/g.166247 Transcript_69347/m.166247 type:complete len:260 (+) Transcript_69347:155-934(+)
MGNHLAKVVFQPPPPQYRGDDTTLINLETSCGNRIPAFFLECRGAHFTLLFSHGNAEDLGLIFRYFEDFRNVMRCSIMCYEYSGYGASTGVPEEHAVYADIEAAFRYLRDVRKIPWERIVPYGRSIGTAPSVHLATRTPVRGLVLQSPMMSIYRIPFQFRFTLPGDRFNSVDKISKICSPVFIIHGTRDEIVPVWHGEGLHRKCVQHGISYSPYWVDQGDHNNLEIQAAESFHERFRQFLQYLEQTPVSDKLRQQVSQL